MHAEEAPGRFSGMYHAATYHRLHVNVSGRPRIGVLQSFVRIPRHVWQALPLAASFPITLKLETRRNYSCLLSDASQTEVDKG